MRRVWVEVAPGARGAGGVLEERVTMTGSVLSPVSGVESEGAPYTMGPLVEETQ